jgi:hypothetical protein
LYRRLKEEVYMEQLDRYIALERRLKEGLYSMEQAGRTWT